MSDQTIIVVKNDNIVGYKPRHDITSKEIYRVAALWLTNYRGDILLAQRAFNEEHHPGKWGPAVAGTVEKGENYYTNITKEAKEELGITGLDFNKGPKEFSSDEYTYFIQWYTATIDKDSKDFTVDTNDVAQVRCFTKEEIKEKLDKESDFFTPNFPNYFKLFDKCDK